MCGCDCCGGQEEKSPIAPSGPPQRNKVCCTDVVFLILFIAFLGGMGFITYFGMKNGDLQKLVSGYDSYGNVCGRDNRNNSINGSIHSGQDMTNKKFVFFMDIRLPKKSVEICVEKCPEVQLNSTTDLKSYASDEGVSYCNYDVKHSDIEGQKTCDGSRACKGPCPVLPVEKSAHILNRCYPKDILDDALDKLRGLVLFFNQIDFLQRLAFDITVAWKKLVVLALLSLVTSLLMILLIRFLAAIIVYVILVLASIAMVIGTVALWWIWATHDTPNEEGKLIPYIEIAYDTKKAFLVYSIIATVITVILLIVFIVLRKSIALCVELFQQAGQMFAHCPYLLFQPVWTFVWLAAFLVYWVAVAGFLGTSGEPIYNETTTYVEYHDSLLLKIFYAYHFVGLIWVSQFILACQELVVGSVVAQYYFIEDKSTISFPIFKAIGITIKHHLGSIALGSFIITLVKIPRYILLWVQSQMKGKEDECTKCCLRTCTCCLWCLEKCLKFLNRNAYVTIAITGHSFCKSARSAFATLVLNAGRVAALNSIGDFVLFLGKIAVVAIVATASVFWFKAEPETTEYIFLPVLISCIIAYFIAHCFISVYEMTVDALLLCTCEGEKRQAGSGPLHSSMTRMLSKREKYGATEQVPMAETEAH